MCRPGDSCGELVADLRLCEAPGPGEYRRRACFEELADVVIESVGRMIATARYQYRDLFGPARASRKPSDHEEFQAEPLGGIGGLRIGAAFADRSVELPQEDACGIRPGDNESIV